MTSWTPESSYAAELARTQEYVRRLEQDNERLRQDLQQLRAERSPAVNPYKRPSVGEGGSALSPYPPGLTRSPHAVPDHGAPPDISRYSLNSPYQPRTPVYPAPNGGAEPVMPSTSTYPRYGEPAYRASGSLDVPPTSSPAVAAVLAVEGPGSDRPLGSERVILRRPSQLDIARLPPPTLPPIATATSGYPSGSAGYDTRQFPATTSSPARIPVSFVETGPASASPGGYHSSIASRPTYAPAHLASSGPLTSATAANSTPSPTASARPGAIPSPIPVTQSPAPSSAA
ncbi:hypothetical protein IWQ60_012485, partial [Tieghemiomyces parasiticus]